MSYIIFCRFKHHMIDLVFMERIARWLTNTQVKIKAEVANSNSQAQQLAQFLNDVVRRIDACERPNLDKEVRRKYLSFKWETLIFILFRDLTAHASIIL